MISFGVIMLAEVCQGAAQRGFTEQNELGKTVAFDRAYPPLRVTIQIWAACRQSHTAYPAGHGSIAEVRAELLVAIVQHVGAPFQIPRSLERGVRSHLSRSARVRSAR